MASSVPSLADNLTGELHKGKSKYSKPSIEFTNLKFTNLKNDTNV